MCPAVRRVRAVQRVSARGTAGECGGLDLDKVAIDLICALAVMARGAMLAPFCGA